jgi:hypothetical protein
MRGSIRSIRPLGHRNHEDRQPVRLHLSCKNRRVRQIRTPTLGVRLRNKKHQMRMPMPNAVVQVPLLPAKATPSYRKRPSGDRRSVNSTAPQFWIPELREINSSSPRSFHYAYKAVLGLDGDLITVPPKHHDLGLCAMDGGAALRAKAISAVRSAIRYCSSGTMVGYEALAS